jgi:hypothetical protein
LTSSFEYSLSGVGSRPFESSVTLIDVSGKKAMLPYQIYGVLSHISCFAQIEQNRHDEAVTGLIG